MANIINGSFQNLRSLSVNLFVTVQDVNNIVAAAPSLLPNLTHLSLAGCPLVVANSGGYHHTLSLIPRVRHTFPDNQLFLPLLGFEIPTQVELSTIGTGYHQYVYYRASVHRHTTLAT